MLQETRVLQVSTSLHKQANFMVRWQLEQKGGLLERLWIGQKNYWIHERRLAWVAWAQNYLTEARQLDITSDEAAAEGSEKE